MTRSFWVSVLLMISFKSSGQQSEESLSFVTEVLPPYQVLEHGQIKGFSTELIEHTLKHANIPYTLAVNSWTRSYKLALQNKNTCIYSIARLPFREPLFHWVGSLTNTNMVIFGAKGQQPYKLDSLNDAKNYTVAVIKDDVTHQALLNAGFVNGENLYVVENTSSLLKLLTTRDNIDLIVADDITIHYRAKLANISMDKVSRLFEMPDLPLNFYLACHKETSPKLLEKLDFSLLQIKKNGTYDKVFAKWQNYLPEKSIP